MSGDAAATDRVRLLDLLRSRSLKTGDFLLASGARSRYYIDARLTTMSGTGQVLIGGAGLALIDTSGWRPQAIGGLTLGADPVAYAIAHAATLAGRELDAFTVRKDVKSHGASRLIEGAVIEGRDVVVVEDVVTKGESALRAIAAVEAGSGRVLGVLALVDREEGGRQKIEDAGHRLVSMFTARELLDETG